MSWCAGCLALVLVAAPPPQVESGARRFNTEPVVLAATGAIAVAFSAWRFVVADGILDQMNELPTSASSRAHAVELLTTARALAFTGNSETALAGMLAVMGGALLITGLVWFFVEGSTTTDWLTGRF
ncbi:MAG: hypothetical protein Q8L14_03370 [Myxococcales bacterium]|nr:hypothetical protein [Myxococcales bacterium]